MCKRAEKALLLRPEKEDGKSCTAQAVDSRQRNTNKLRDYRAGVEPLKATEIKQDSKMGVKHEEIYLASNDRKNN